jgi:dsRNA-specific ribonuclease
MHKRLTDMDPAVRDKLDEYAVAITAKRARADTQLEKGKASHEFWNQIPGHKWMGDVVEALFGAIFEDSGFDVPTVRGVFEQHLFPFLDKYAVPPAEHSLHPKSMLLELLATRRCHQWSIERTPAPDGPEGHVAATVIVHGTVVGSAVEPKVALAVRSACDEALTTLKDVTVCPCM